MRPSNLFVGSLAGITLLAILAPTARLLQFPDFLHEFLDLLLIIVASLWLVIVVIDYLILRKRAELNARREMANSLAVGHKSIVELSVRHNYTRTVKMIVHDR